MTELQEVESYKDIKGRKPYNARLRIKEEDTWTIQINQIN